MQNGSGNLENRLVVLEEKLEYQDYTQEKLNEVIIAQQRQIDKLELELMRLKEKIDVQELEAEKQEAAASVPPHY